jgi:hypothetical protein
VRRPHGAGSSSKSGVRVSSRPTLHGARRRRRRFQTSQSGLDVIALMRFCLPLRAPGRCIEPVGKVLNLVSDLSVAKFHDADGGDGASIVKDDVFGDPEVSAAERTLHLKTSLGGILGARFEYVAAAVNAERGCVPCSDLPRLRPLGKLIVPAF